MNITCPSCASRYAVDDSRVPDQGVTIRCPSCQHKFVVKPELDAPVSLPPSAPPQGAPPQGAEDEAVALPGGAGARRAPAAGGSDDSVPLPGSTPPAPAREEPSAPSFDELSFPSVSSSGGAPTPPEEDSLDLGLDEDGLGTPRPQRPAFQPPDDLPGLPNSPSPSLPDLPDLPGLPDGPDRPEPPASRQPREFADLPGLPEAKGAPSGADLPDLPGLPDPADLPGLRPSDDILGFIDEQAAQVSNLGAGGATEFRVRRRSGQIDGPFGAERIQALIRAGQLTGGEDVSTDGVSWRAMTSVPAFNEALNQAAGESYGEVPFGGSDAVSPVGLDLPAPSGLPTPQTSGLTGDFGGLSLDTGPVDRGAEAAALDEVDAMMDELDGSAASSYAGGGPLGDGPLGDGPLGGHSPHRGGQTGGLDAGMPADPARDVLEVGEIPELPPVWKTYRKQIIAFSSVAVVVLVGVYTQLFTSVGAFGIPGLVRWALTEPPPPPPPAPPRRPLRGWRGPRWPR